MIINSVGRPDLEEVSEVLAEAFQQDPVSSWVFPDPVRRRKIQPAFFHAFTTLALEIGGEVYLTGDRRATTVWFPPYSGDAEDDDDLLARFGALDADELERFAVLADVMAANHPAGGPHWHLQFIGVLPDQQQSGVGAALLTHRLARMDIPAYLEASSERSPHLYERHGFRHVGEPYAPPGGPNLYPMWREPQS